MKEAHPLIAGLLEKRKSKENADGKWDNLVGLTGFLGEADSPEKGIVHLYTNLNLNSYYVLRTKDVVHHASVDATDVNSPHKVWVPADAVVRFVVTGEVTALMPCVDALLTMTQELNSLITTVKK